MPFFSGNPLAQSTPWPDNSFDSPADSRVARKRKEKHHAHASYRRHTFGNMPPSDRPTAPIHPSSHSGTTSHAKYPTAPAHATGRHTCKAAAERDNLLR